MPRVETKDRQGEDQEYECSASSDSSRFLIPDKIQQLWKCQKNLKNLINEASKSQDKQKCAIVFKYCGKYRNWHLEPAEILGIMNKRIQAATRNKKIKKNWSKTDLDLLVWVLHQHCSLAHIDTIQNMSQSDWQKISSYIPASFPDSCMFRILNLKAIKLSENSWNRDEQFMLKQIIEENKNSTWRSISELLYHSKKDEKKIFRTAKQCKEHWNCYLNPKLRKGPWSLEEDIKLLENISQNSGKKKWVRMAKVFNGRTQNALKNRFTFLVSSHQDKDERDQNELVMARKILKILSAAQERKASQNMRNNENNLEENQLEFKQSRIQQNPQIHQINNQTQLRDALQVREYSSPGFRAYSREKEEGEAGNISNGLIPVFYNVTPYFLIFGSNKFDA